ncbi:MAG: PilZ domain-containing protein [Candidatus Methylomirabilales bacterium]
MRAKRMKEDRRVQPRSVVGSQLAARINYIYEAAVIDISASGAMIEHMNHVRPGTVSFVTMLFHVKAVGLKCRVVRSVVHRYEVGPAGERDLIYRTGLQFVDALAGTPSLTR